MKFYKLSFQVSVAIATANGVWPVFNWSEPGLVSD